MFVVVIICGGREMKNDCLNYHIWEIEREYFAGGVGLIIGVM